MSVRHDASPPVDPRLFPGPRRALLAWFAREARDLPWRRTRDPYCIWLSEIMLQQTRVEQGTPYYERFLAAFPTVEALAHAPEDAVLKLWEGLGYYTRARNLQKAARIVVEERGGQFPRSALEWRSLPGVGRYTAGAIASIALGERVAVLDGNVKRVFSRLFNTQECIDTPATEQHLWSLAELFVPAKRPGDFNQALMELGARVCVPRAPLCGQCPIRTWCSAHAAGVQLERPVRRQKKSVPHQQWAVAAILHRGRYLLGKRPPKGLLAGLWEFPGCRMVSKTREQTALANYARDSLGIEINVGELLATVQHAYSHFTVTLRVFRCRYASGRIRSKEHTELKWVPRAQLSRYALPKANHKFVTLLEDT